MYWWDPLELFFTPTIQFQLPLLLEYFLLYQWLFSAHVIFTPLSKYFTPSAQTWLCICSKTWRRKICQVYNLLTDPGGEPGIIKWGRIFPCIQYCGNLIQKNKMVELPVDFQTGSIFRKLTQMLGPYIFPRELESQVNRVAFCMLVIGTNIKQIEQHLIFFHKWFNWIYFNLTITINAISMQAVWPNIFL